MLEILKRSSRTSIIAFLTAFVYELLKQSIKPNLTVWQSHAVTIVFITVVAFVVSVAVLHHEVGSRAALLHDLECRQILAQQLRVQATALEAAANAIIITDANGKILWVNRAFTALTGYSAQEAVGTTPKLLKSGEHDEAFYAELWKTIKSGLVWRGEITNRRKDGSFYVEEMTVTPVHAGEGISHFIAIKVDGTNRKLAEEALMQSEAALHSMVQNAPYGIYRATLSGNILRANPAFCQMLGYESEAELRSVKLEQMYCNPADREPLVNSLVANGSLRRVEARWKRKTGESIVVRMNSHLSGSKGSDPVFEDYVEDITENKRADEELRRLNRALSTLSKCNEALVHAGSEIELLNNICDIVVRVGGYRLAWVGYLGEHRDKPVRVVANAGFDDGYLEKVRISWGNSDRGRGPMGTAIRTGEVCIFRNLRDAPEFSPWRDDALQRGYESIIALPLKQESRMLGAIALYAAEPAAFDDREVALLKELANDLAYGIVSLRNIEERNQAEATLKESEERYRFLFAHNPHPMWIADMGTHAFVEVNDTAVESYGYLREEFKSMKLEDIRPPEDIPALQSALADATDGSTFRGRFRHRKKDGTVIDVELVAYRFLQRGRLLSLALATDITETLRVESALRNSEERYRMLFDHNLAAVFHSCNGQLQDCNEAMCRMFGYTREEMPSLDLRTLYCDPAVREMGQKLLYDSGRLANYQVDLKTKNGTTITVLANLNLLRPQPQEAPIVVGVMLDITEVHKLQEQLAQSQKLEALGKLTGGIAHDFNNILMIINSYAEIVLDNLDAQNPLRRPIEQIHAAGARAASLTRQLLAFSRKQVMAPIVLDLGQLVSDLEEMLRRLLGEDVQLETACAKDLAPTLADPTQIEQVVINLAVNARDAMPTGGRLLIRTQNVKLGPEFVKAQPGSKAGRYVSLTVSDTGCGMSEDVQARIFEPFFTTKEPGRGTGLGLSTVYGIVKQSDGYITVDSDLGRGTSFCIYLPQTEGHTKGGHEQFEGSLPLNATVLLVEDEEATREAIGAYLVQHGARVLSALNPREALRISDQHSPGEIGVLLTDVIMPGMNGNDLALHFRERHPSAKIVFMSGYTDDVLSRSGMKQPNIALLSKPFRLADLITKINNVLASSDAPQTEKE